MHIPELPPRSLDMQLDLPIWDSSLPVDGQRLDNQLEALFRIPSIRASGDYDRAVLHQVATGWTKRFDDLEALRGAILALAPHRARNLTDAVRVGRQALAPLQAADTPGATRDLFERAVTALDISHDTMSDLRWGVPADIRAGRYVTPGDIARSRIQQFDGDGDSRVSADEYTHVRERNEMVFDEPRTFQQTFDGHRLFTPADADGAADGLTTVAELEAMLTRWDGNGDGWLTRSEFDEFEARGDAALVEQHPVRAQFPDPAG